MRADVELRPITADFDAEFARAADAFEADKREEGLHVLEAIRAKSMLVPAAASPFPTSLGTRVEESVK